jgi:hypothetical protein
MARTGLDDLLHRDGAFGGWLFTETRRIACPPFSSAARPRAPQLSGGIFRAAPQQLWLGPSEFVAVYAGRLGLDLMPSALVFFATHPTQGSPTTDNRRLFWTVPELGRSFSRCAAVRFINCFQHLHNAGRTCILRAHWEAVLPPGSPRRRCHLSPGTEQLRWPQVCRGTF